MMKSAQEISFNQVRKQYFYYLKNQNQSYYQAEGCFIYYGTYAAVVASGVEVLSEIWKQFKL